MQGARPATTVAEGSFLDFGDRTWIPLVWYSMSSLSNSATCLLQWQYIEIALDESRPARVARKVWPRDVQNALCIEEITHCRLGVLGGGKRQGIVEIPKGVEIGPNRNAVTGRSSTLRPTTPQN